MDNPHSTNGTGASRSSDPDELAAFHESFTALTADISTVSRAAQSLLFTWQAYHRLNEQFGPDHPEHGIGIGAMEFLAAELWSSAERIQHSTAELLSFIDIPIPQDPAPEDAEEAEAALV